MYRKNASKRPGALFLAKIGKMRSKRPPVKNKNANERRGHAVNAPSITLRDTRPGTELARHLSVGDGAVFEAGKRGALHRKVDISVGTCFALTAAKQVLRYSNKTKSDADREPKNMHRCSQYQCISGKQILEVLRVLAVLRASTLRVLRVFRANTLLDTSILAAFRGSILWLLPVLQVFWGSILGVLAVSKISEYVQYTRSKIGFPQNTGIDGTEVAP